jgi:transposase
MLDLAAQHSMTVASCVLDGPIKGQSFVVWIQQMLVPELKEGDAVIIDNLPKHKVPDVREAITA